MSSDIASASPSRLRAQIVGIIIAAVLALAALALGAFLLYRAMYSPSAFAERYLVLLAEGRAADALTIPGVGVDGVTLEAAGISPTSSDALLRSTALSTLDDIERVSEERDGDVTRVTVSYTASGFPAETTFEIERAGSIGVVPEWRFARSPLAVIDLDLVGSDSFDVNGFALTRGQASPLGAEATGADRLSLLVFSPGRYRLTVDTPLATAAPIDVIADTPLQDTPVSIAAAPQPAFLEAVTDQVHGFLEACTEQRVLQPTGCPYGLTVRNRIATLPQWSIAEFPAVSLSPTPTGWVMADARGVARIDVDIQSLFDGSVTPISEDVEFWMNASITVLPDGSASIQVGIPAQ